MPAMARITREWFRSYRPIWVALPLTTIVITPCSIHAETLPGLSGAIESTESAGFSGSLINAGAAIGAKIALQPGLVEASRRLPPGKVLKEVAKQAIDQPGHFLISAAPIWASRYLVGVPWFGWIAAPILAYREWLQWPSRRWWDPPLDWAFLTLGAVAATRSRVGWHRLAVGVAAFGQRMASGFVVRGRLPQRA
jgi:hypothetical protein